VIAAHLAEVGRLREEITVQTTSVVLFALNSSEFFLLLARDRNWPPFQFELWLADAWKRLHYRAPAAEETAKLFAP
jgi:hypothetical protein